MRRIRSLAAVCLLSLVLGGCSLFASPLLDAQLLVQGNLDVVYLNQPSEDYLQLVSSTEEEARQDYEDGIWVEVDAAASYFYIDLELCDESISQRLYDLLCSIYAYSSYQVGEATQTETGYVVEVTVDPIDIFQKMLEEDYDDAYEEIWANQDFTSATEEEYETAWAQFILELLEARLDSIGYLEAVTVSVHVEQNDEGYYAITDEDFSQVDWYILSYGDGE